MGMWRRRRMLYVMLSMVGVIYITGTMLPILTHKTRRNSDTPLLQSILLSYERGYISGGVGLHRSDPLAKHAFNIVVSDKLKSNRVIPDSRDKNCKGKDYDVDSFKTTSVVICFHNEARSALLRTVISVLNRTPDDLLQEIILIDDYSEDEASGHELKKLPKIRLIRNERREGLIKSRVRGAEVAIGDYIMFLDSHCEVNIGWLEPLLSRLSLNPASIASPVIDVIEFDTMHYKPSSPNLKGGFDWSLHFKWIPISQEERKIRKITDPFSSPAISGGLFLISRRWFMELGAFDTGMGVWGGESLELSLKAWLCGGQVEIIPCSRVGHIFRKKHPYSFPEGNSNTYLRNTKRIAEVWLEEYKTFFYGARSSAALISTGDLTDQFALKQKLECKSFQWYLENVFKELRLPNEENSAFGEVRQDSLCLATEKMNVTLAACKDNQVQWALHIATGQIKLIEHIDEEQNLCLTPFNKIKLGVRVCDIKNKKQRWKRVGASIVHVKSALCVESRIRGVALGACRRGTPSQLWDFTVELQTLHDTKVNIR